jgi:hypothetical protein
VTQPWRGDPAAWLLVGVIATLPTLTGCANPRTDDTFDELAEPAPNVETTPFARPTETGYLDLVRTYCGRLAVGDASVAALLDTDRRFLAATKGLYHGELTNDEFIREVLERHPAQDANADAIGCIVNQLQKCYSERCSVPAARRPLPKRDPPEGLEVYDEL